MPGKQTEIYNNHLQWQTTLQNASYNVVCLQNGLKWIKKVCNESPLVPWQQRSW